MAVIDWNHQLADQLDWQWTTATRPRLEGLTDDEYLWEPAPGAWSIRRRAETTTSDPLGVGEYVLERSEPEPDPAPVTTIAWRMAHIIVDCFAARTRDHFGGPDVRWSTFAPAGTVKQALAQLDDAYAAWIEGVRALGSEGLARECGPAEGPFAAEPLAALVLHINREVLHHGAELALLRDLYRAQNQQPE
jgi:hypothetical protein